MSFQKTVVSVAMVMLVILLLVIGVALYKQKNNANYPPVTGTCPDYWMEQDDNNDGTKCVNVKNLGSSSCKKEMDFSVYPWNGDDGTCNKYKWAKACDLTWDGITNNNNACDKT